MKLTSDELRQIINEEYRRVMAEQITLPDELKQFLINNVFEKYNYPPCSGADLAEPIPNCDRYGSGALAMGYKAALGGERKIGKQVIEFLERQFEAMGLKYRAYLIPNNPTIRVVLAKDPEQALAKMQEISPKLLKLIAGKPMFAGAKDPHAGMNIELEKKTGPFAIKFNPGKDTMADFSYRGPLYVIYSLSSDQLDAGKTYAEWSQSKAK